MKLYSYYRSSASYRVRIALNLKQIDYELIPVNLLNKEQQTSSYKQKQPQGLVPCLETDAGQFLSQSGAILNYLENIKSSHPLMPEDSHLATQVRGFADIIACDIQPICNLRVANYLNQHFEANDQQKIDWHHHWISLGFEALESKLSDSTYCFGDTPTLADVYLIPQVYNALRFKLDMQTFPHILAIYQACNQLQEFVAAKPENQVDCV